MNVAVLLPFLILKNEIQWFFLKLIKRRLLGIIRDKLSLGLKAKNFKLFPRLYITLFWKTLPTSQVAILAFNFIKT